MRLEPSAGGQTAAIVKLERNRSLRSMRKYVSNCFPYNQSLRNPASIDAKNGENACPTPPIA
jgi:hypothetical protein